ncbi:g5490 [Coccomyxa viridis]|uniref:G5490 protein n=1 Tax=Coccomyxa viridis TaxID=1274662 RepID=A0ABP1FWX4_9CHLO
MSTYFVPTRFIWRFGGQVVHLCGSFTRWVETVPMAPVDGSPGVFSIVVHLPPGYHQYKFIVDGEWRHDEMQPFMPDPLGNVNNWLFVRKPESQSAPQQLQQTQSATSTGSQQMAQSSQAVSMSAEHANALQPPAQHMMPQASSSPSLQQDSSPAPMAVQMAPSMSGDMDMDNVESSADSVIPSMSLQADEPDFTRNKVRVFLRTHTCYELIPESGKVVILDVGLPIRQAFHALHEQAVASAPLWDEDQGMVIGMISASDFIHVLRRLRHSVTSGGNQMSEAEMDQHTIRGLREEAAQEGRPPKALVSLHPADALSTVLQKLFRNRCSMAPVLTGPSPAGRDRGPTTPTPPGTPPLHSPKSREHNEEACSLLHIATISGVLAALMRHFRASLASLPLLGQAIGTLPLGTWSSQSILVQRENNGLTQGEERRDRRKVGQLHTVQPTTPLTTALSMLLEAGVSVLPIVDANGVLIDQYARADITQLAKGNAYNRLQWEEMTVGQALALAQIGNPPWPASQPGMPPQQGQGGEGNAARPQRVFVCTAHDTLRSIVERLSVPGVRRLFVVDLDTRRMEGIVSLSDVAAYLFDVF